MNTSVAVGDRVRQLRLAKDFSQAELAERLEIKGNAQVSKIENGRVSPSAPLLEDLGRALGCGSRFLELPPLDALYTRPWLRAYADASVRAVDGVLMSNLLHHEVTQRLGLKRIPESIPTFDEDLHDDDAIEIFSQEVRAMAGIEDDAPVGNVARALERLGCVVLPLDDELGRHLGLSQYIDGVPYVRVSRPRSNVPGDRQRFTLAHELGHLALHASQSPPDTSEAARRIETQAHRFAGAFLTPRRPLLDDLERLGGRVTLSVLQDLKGQWGVAIKMLVTRLRQLGAVEDDQAVSLYKQISKRGWNSGEPVVVSHEQAIWFERSLQQRWQGQDPALATSNELGIGADMVRDWMNWHESQPETASAEVIVLTPKSQPRTSQHSGGSVTPLGVKR